MEETELTPEEREAIGLDPEPQDGPGDLDALPEEDFVSYASEDAEVHVSDPSKNPEPAPEPPTDQEVDNE